MKIPRIKSSQKHSLILLSFFYIFFSPRVCAQIPQGIPKDMGPIDFSSTTNIIIYIVLPIIVIIGFIFWRMAIRKRNKEREEENENEI